MKLSRNSHEAPKFSERFTSSAHAPAPMRVGRNRRRTRELLKTWKELVNLRSI